MKLQYLASFRKWIKITGSLKLWLWQLPRERKLSNILTFIVPGRNSLDWWDTRGDIIVLLVNTDAILNYQRSIHCWSGGFSHGSSCCFSSFACRWRGRCCFCLFQRCCSCERGITIRQHDVTRIMVPLRNSRS